MGEETVSVMTDHHRRTKTMLDAAALERVLRSVRSRVGRRFRVRKWRIGELDALDKKGRAIKRFRCYMITGQSMDDPQGRRFGASTVATTELLRDANAVKYLASVLSGQAAEFLTKAKDVNP